MYVIEQYQYTDKHAYSCLRASLMTIFIDFFKEYHLYHTNLLLICTGFGTAKPLNQMKSIGAYLFLIMK